MLLATRCPFCETVFRLQSAQLALRRGLVRCGHCREVFDASNSLFELASSGDFNAARPITADSVARLIAQAEREAQAGASGAAAAGAAAGVVDEPAAPAFESPASIAPSAPDDSSVAGRHGAPAAESSEPSAPLARDDSSVAAPHGAPAAESSAPSTPLARKDASRAAHHGGTAAESSAPSAPFARDDASRDAHHGGTAAESPTPSAPLARDDASRAAHHGGPAAESSAPSAPFARDDASRDAHHGGTAAESSVPSAPFARDDASVAGRPGAPGSESSTPSAPSAPFAPDPADPNAPDFRAESWNPWAPAPDASVDRRIRQNAATIPYNPVTVPPDALPKLKLEFTDGQNLHLENATAHPVEPSFRTPPEPATAPEVPVPAPPAAPVWREARARPEPALEPDDRTMVPPVVSDGEPHFGPSPAKAASAEPFASEPFASEPFVAAPFAAAPLHDDDAFAVVREKRAPESRRIGLRIFGGLIAVLLVVMLLAQLAWWQRETVMVYAPSTRMLFAQVCTQLGCSFSPPRDIDGLQVDPSDLRQVDGPHKLELKMPLHNRYNVALAYPAIELTLLDEHNNVAIRRVLWPQDYVKPGTPIAAGLPPRTTETMFVRLDTGPATATNFRVQIFYP